jgi:hypothetical protein
MSATTTPPAGVDAPLDTAAQLPRPVAAPARPAVPLSRPTHPSVSSGRLGNALFIATWTPALAVAGVVAAAVLAVAQPILIARVLYEERRYR